MRRLALCVALVASLIPAVFAAETATVTRVVDGDTIVVSIAGRQEKVRLIGVVTPGRWSIGGGRGSELERWMVH